MNHIQISNYLPDLVPTRFQKAEFYKWDVNSFKLCCNVSDVYSNNSCQYKNKCTVLEKWLCKVASWVVWRKGAGAGKREQVTELPEGPIVRPSTMIQLPPNFSLPFWPALVWSSERNVAQIRISACWGGSETGKQKEGNNVHSSQFTHLLLSRYRLNSLKVWSLDVFRPDGGHTHSHSGRR